MALGETKEEVVELVGFFDDGFWMQGRVFLDSAPPGQERVLLLTEVTRYRVTGHREPGHFIVESKHLLEKRKGIVRINACECWFWTGRKWKKLVS